MPQVGKSPVERILRNQAVATYIANHSNVKERAREAVQWLLKKHPAAREDGIVQTLLDVLPSLSSEHLRVFFSYKAKDRTTAKTIADWLQEWSAGKLEVEHMGNFGVEEVGREWRKRIEETIPTCDWFLLLLPTPGEEANERDWVLFEAGYYWRGRKQDLSRRLVCLHHPDNEVANALEEHQSVPAEVDKVKDFLTGLFHESNWIPGMPPLNEKLSGLETKAKAIVDLIQRPSFSKWSCCGPHMEVTYDDLSAVKGWEQLAAGRVKDSNDECKQLFGLQVSKPSFGDWLEAAEGVRQNEGWVAELAQALRAAGEGRKVTPIHSTLILSSKRRVRPLLCAVKRCRSDHRVEAVNISFAETTPSAETGAGSEELAALAITLHLAVRFRYQVLESYAGRKLEPKDVRALNREMNKLTGDALRHLRFVDPLAIRGKVISLFAGEDQMLVKRMYERADQLWHPAGEGEIEQAIDNVDLNAVAKLIQELVGMNERFLIVASKRMMELISGSQLAQDDGQPRYRRTA